MSEYPEHDEISNGRNPQSPPRSNRRAGVIGLVAVGGLAAGGAALYVANSAGAAPSSSTSASTPASASSSSSSSATCTAPGPVAGRGRAGRPAGGPAASGPGRGPAGAGAGADGRITAVSATSLTVKDLFAKSHTYRITSTTVVHSGPARAVKVSALTVGEHVVVRTAGSTSTAADIDLHLAHIDGSVTAVTGSAITVTDRDGFTRTIDTDGQTSYTLNSASFSRSKVTAGSVVHAEGKVDADGTALDASSVDVATSAKAPAPGGGARPCAPFAGRGPGGPGHHGGPPAAAKPSSSGGSSTPATPTPSATTTR